MGDSLLAVYNLALFSKLPHSLLARRFVYLQLSRICAMNCVTISARVC